MTPIEQYYIDLQKKDFVEDASQLQAVIRLNDLFHRLVSRIDLKPAYCRFWPSILSKDNNLILPEKGIYFWGGVGRGKTYLVDRFFELLPFEKKMRMHFHRFMYRIHQELKNLNGQSDPLLKIADKLANETSVICFDEFFVSDITDAMLLGTLLEALFARGICLVATSNIPPDELYRNGLQRSRFLPAITLICKHCEIVNLDGGVDHRLRTLEQANIYYSPLDAKAKQNLQHYFEALAIEPYFFEQSIEINHRFLPTIRHAQGVVQFDFKNLCEGPTSQSDYIEIARLYHTVLLSNVLVMSNDKDDAARRFIAMVDEFYERHVTLIISAQVPLMSLYTKGRLLFEFTRCCSRLQEMQSQHYLALAHLP